MNITISVPALFILFCYGCLMCLERQIMRGVSIQRRISLSLTFLWMNVGIILANAHQDVETILLVVTYMNMYAGLLIIFIILFEEHDWPEEVINAIRPTPSH